MVKVFQYGSNTDVERLVSRMRNRLGRTPRVLDLGQAVASEHRIVFDLYSKGNRCAAANLTDAPNSSRVHGRLFEIHERDLPALRAIEGVSEDGTGNYRETDIDIDGIGGKVITFVGTEAGKERYQRSHVRSEPSNEYLGHVVRGLSDRSMDVPLEYISGVIEEGRARMSTASMHVDATYSNKRDYHKALIGMSKEIRESMGVSVRDFVEVEHDGRTLNLQVARAPKQLLKGDSAAVDPVTLSGVARRYLGLSEVSQRDTPRFSSVYEGIKIMKR